ncbi:hypothetical protein DSL72_005638 [Monilinia vaccinii-corymbosi]|uniref:rRNA-processing protein FYV7 n=1 Tax=Monilinia vaccinii-corymbosi TaxID=61207 RepID=A0A8A3PFV0_9HELO|nr:hypothetical protein DSL72_005638 [Monilinia vaccinii-corymbosi]
MAPTKRPREGDATSRPTPKKPRHGFKVGPDNLPDGAWRRKVIAIKKDLIHKAKVKKSYAKLRAREPLKEERNVYAELEKEEKEDGLGKEERGEGADEEEAVELHPQRRAMLDEPEVDTAAKTVPRYSNTSDDPREKKGERREKRGAKPAYFAKELEFAERKKAEQKARREELERKEREKKAKMEERERFRRQMAKARSGGKNGQRNNVVKAVAVAENRLERPMIPMNVIAHRLNGVRSLELWRYADAPNKRFASLHFPKGIISVLNRFSLKGLSSLKSAIYNTA